MPEIPSKPLELAPILPQNAQNPGIYRLLEAGEILHIRDAVYCPAQDEWLSLTRACAELIGQAYDPDRLGPVRRFNK